MKQVIVTKEIVVTRNAVEVTEQQGITVYFDDKALRYVDVAKKDQNELLKQVARACYSRSFPIADNFSVSAAPTSSSPPKLSSSAGRTQVLKSQSEHFYIPRVYRSKDGEYLAILVSEHGAHKVKLNLVGANSADLSAQEPSLVMGTGTIQADIVVEKGDSKKLAKTVSVTFGRLPGPLQQKHINIDQAHNNIINMIEEMRSAQLQDAFGASKPYVTSSAVVVMPAISTEEEIEKLIAAQTNEAITEASNEASNKIEAIYQEMAAIVDDLDASSKGNVQYQKELLTLKNSQKGHAVYAQYEGFKKNKTLHDQKVKEKAKDDVKDKLEKDYNDKKCEILKKQENKNVIALEASLRQELLADVYNAGRAIYENIWAVGSAVARHRFFNWMNGCFAELYYVNAISGCPLSFGEICENDKIKSLTVVQLGEKINSIITALSQHESKELREFMQNKMYDVLNLNKDASANALGFKEKLGKILHADVKKKNIVEVNSKTVAIKRANEKIEHVEVGEVFFHDLIKQLIEKASDARKENNNEVNTPHIIVEEIEQAASVSLVDEYISEIKIIECRDSLAKLKEQYNVSIQQIDEEGQQAQLIRNTREIVSGMRTEVGELSKQVKFSNGLKAQNEEVLKLERLLSSVSSSSSMTKEQINHYNELVSKQKEKLDSLFKGAKAEIDKSLDACIKIHNECQEMITSVNKKKVFSGLKDILAEKEKAAKNANAAASTAKELFDAQLNTAKEEINKLDSELDWVKKINNAREAVVAIAVPETIEFPNDNGVKASYAAQLKIIKDAKKAVAEADAQVNGANETMLKELKKTVKQNQLQTEQAILAHAVVNMLGFIRNHIIRMDFTSEKNAAWKNVGFFQLFQVVVEKYDDKWINDNEQACKMLQDLCNSAMTLIDATIAATADQVDQASSFFGVKKLMGLLVEWSDDNAIAISGDEGIQKALMALSDLRQEAHVANKVQETSRSANVIHKIGSNFSKVTEEHLSVLKGWYQDIQNASNATKLKGNARVLQFNVSTAADEAELAQNQLQKAVQEARDAQQQAEEIINQQQTPESQVKIIVKQVAAAKMAMQKIDDAAKVVSSAPQEEQAIEEQKRNQLNFSQSPAKIAVQQEGGQLKLSQSPEEKAAEKAIKSMKKVIGAAGSKMATAIEVMNEHKSVVEELEKYITELQEKFPAIVLNEDKQSKLEPVSHEPVAVPQASQPVPVEEEAPKSKSGVLDFIENNWYWMLLGAVAAVATLAVVIVTHGAAIPAISAVAAAAGVPVGVVATAAGAAIFGAAAALAGAACALVVSGICSGVKALFGSKQKTQPAAQSMIASVSSSQDGVAPVVQIPCTHGKVNGRLSTYSTSPMPIVPTSMGSAEYDDVGRSTSLGSGNSSGSNTPVSEDASLGISSTMFTISPVTGRGTNVDVTQNKGVEVGRGRYTANYNK